jgi:hypothetical protein
MLDDKGGEDSGLKYTNLCCLGCCLLFVLHRSDRCKQIYDVWAAVCCLCCTALTSALHRSDRCLLADESSLVISLELHLSRLENICVSANVCLNLL